MRAFSLDSGVLLYLLLGFLLRQLVSWSFPFVVRLTTTRLLIGGDSSKVCSPNIFKVNIDIFFPECIFKEALVDGFMTRVSGHGQVGKEYEGGHRTGNEVGGE